MSTDTPPAAAPAAAPKKSFFRKPLGCLLTLLVGGAFFLVLLLAFGLWFAGSNRALDAAAKFVNQKSGATLTYAENDNNLFAGRVHLKGVEITNPSRFTDKQCFKLNELHAEVKPLSALGKRIEIPVVVVDIGTVSLVGGEKWREDNNLLDLKKAFVPEPATPQPKPEEKPAGEGAKIPPFHIAKLVLRMDKVRIVSDATTPGREPKIITETSIGFSREFTDVTDENLVTDVIPKLKSDVLLLLYKSGKIGLDVLRAEGMSLVNDTLKSGVGAVSDVSGQAGEVVSGAATKAADAIGGLFKKKEKK